jgi:hypothetical protein
VKQPANKLLSAAVAALVGVVGAGVALNAAAAPKKK